jgi:hypothetical protein
LLIAARKGAAKAAPFFLDVIRVLSVLRFQRVERRRDMEVVKV